MGKRVKALTAGAALAASALVVLAQRLYARRSRATSERREMSEAKEIARRVIEEVFNEGRLEAADELFDAGVVAHDPAQPAPTAGVQGVKDVVAAYRAAFPDLRVIVDEQVAESATVATRWTARGTHTGDFMGIPPTGREATVTGMTIDHIASGKIVESWSNWDALGLLKQLGVVAGAPAQV